MNGAIFDTRKFKAYNVSFNENLPFWQDWTFFLEGIVQGISFRRCGDLPADVYIRDHSDENRISNSKQIDSDKVYKIYECVEYFHNIFKNYPGYDPNIYHYRMYYMFGYLIRRDNLSSVQKGIQILESGEHTSNKWYTILKHILIQAIRFPAFVNNRILSYLVHIISERHKNSLVNRI